jgi:hypothetical protein
VLGALATGPAFAAMVPGGGRAARSRALRSLLVMPHARRSAPAPSHCRSPCRRAWRLSPGRLNTRIAAKAPAGVTPLDHKLGDGDDDGIGVVIVITL